MRKVRVLINPKSGTGHSAGAIVRAIDEFWNRPDRDVTYQFSHSIDDGVAKTRRAMADGLDTLILVGGDGLVNTIGRLLVGTPVELGVIPTGSGNGFARHFGIPLSPSRAAKALAEAQPMLIDVGTANGRPFFVTCSLAWDAALVRQFNSFPVRGVIPYVFAAAYELFEYVPQPFNATFDHGETVVFKDPMVFTIANLTQFGGGALVAPHACPDDGQMELVVVTKANAGWLVADIARLFGGTIDKSSAVNTRRFTHLTVQRASPSYFQVDGELAEAVESVEIKIIPRALKVLVPG